MLKIKNFIFVFKSLRCFWFVIIIFFGGGWNSDHKIHNLLKV